MRYTFLTPAVAAILLLLMIGCVTESPPVAGQRPVRTSGLNPETLPVSDSDLREASVKQKQLWKTVVVTPRYENETYALVAENSRRLMRDGFHGERWLTFGDPQDFLTSEDMSNINSIFHDEPRLDALAHENRIDCLVMLETVGIEFESQGVKTEVERLDTLHTSEKFSRDAYVTLRVKVLDTFDMAGIWEGKVTGRSAVGDVSLDSKSKVLDSAVCDAAKQACGEVASRMKPKPSVLEVRGDGKYVKLDVGSAAGVKKGMFFDVYGISGVKDPSGRVISKQANRITSVPVILVGADYCWCDATLSQGSILIGHIAIPSKDQPGI